MRWRTVGTLGFAALFARCGDGKGVIESLVTLPVHSLQLSSEADLLRCFRSDEHRDSKLNFPFSEDETRFGVPSSGKRRNQIKSSQHLLHARMASDFSNSHGCEATLVVMDYCPQLQRTFMRAALLDIRLAGKRNFILFHEQRDSARSKSYCSCVNP